MCGRFTLHENADAIADAFAADVTPIRSTHLPRYNIAPTEEAPVVIAARGGRRAGPMRWGLLPHWARDPRAGTRMINARAETVATRSAFSESFRARRCLVPASGFYEWESRPSGKQPWWIHRPGGSLFAMAGIWSVWPAPDGARIATFAILTRSAPSSIRWLHDRVPVILEDTVWDDWLARGSTTPVLTSVLDGAGQPELELHPVSRAVNRAGWDEPACIERVEPGEPGLGIQLEL
ncbi:MAG: SOS response-associated peptidase [Gemmatimonadota bacterium]|nr:SOS response-associated peptidase [Gemmatimonadota bacterium]MDE2866723.1 SOS response-associated peptidase [Gemmatimonadota bacterium]MXV94691.1 SOS response-associated peptidase [Gemmatimonadota bacterium]MYE15205.1 SOS response-associated peptidase [Gemmatimonadota bacterium]